MRSFVTGDEDICEREVEQVLHIDTIRGLGADPPAPNADVEGQEGSDAVTAECGIRLPSERSGALPSLEQAATFFRIRRNLLNEQVD